MSNLEVLTIEDRERWLEVLASIEQFDVYHLPQYHELAERTGQGQGRLLVYEHANGVIALPLLLRSCGSIEGLEGERSLDAGSVYGYPGPLSASPLPPCDVIADFQSAVRRFLDSLGVAAVFSSLHPLISQRELIAGLGTTTATGVTVSIDLRLSTEAQLAQYRANHARGIRKLRALGAVCEVADPRDLGQFIEIYHETMARVGAAPYYFFDQTYFALLRDLLGSRLKMLTCTLDGEVIAAGLFFVCGDTIHYHLGATRNDRVNLGPMKLIIDAARAWGTEAGMAVSTWVGALVRRRTRSSTSRQASPSAAIRIHHGSG